MFVIARETKKIIAPRHFLSSLSRKLSHQSAFLSRPERQGLNVRVHANYHAPVNRAAFQKLCFQTFLQATVSASVPLTETERAELLAVEAVIASSTRSFWEVGEALAKVRDGKLSRETHATFQEYCQQRWQFSDRRARQLIDAATARANVAGGTIVPVSEGQLRPLTSLRPEQQRAVWQSACESSQGLATGRAVQAAIGRLQVSVAPDQDEAQKGTELPRRRPINALRCGVRAIKLLERIPARDKRRATAFAIVRELLDREMPIARPQAVLAPVANKPSITLRGAVQTLADIEERYRTVPAQVEKLAAGRVWLERMCAWIEQEEPKWEPPA